MSEENKSLVKKRDELQISIDGSKKMALERSETDAEKDKITAKLEAELQAARWQAAELEVHEELTVIRRQAYSSGDRNLEPGLTLSSPEPT